MCLIVFSLGQHPQLPVVLAANRDEFHDRPTASMDWWNSDAAGGNILAGRDLRSGGTWLSVSTSGTVSAVTNVREPGGPIGERSRGELPLLAQALPHDALETDLKARTLQYSGFNLLTVGQHDGWYFGNRDPHPGRQVHRGFYGLSNHLLQTPWPKLRRQRSRLRQILQDCNPSELPTLHATLTAMMQDSAQADDEDLPDTGVGLESERFLSAPFIIGDDYGTRATTIFTLRTDGEIRVTETSWNPAGRQAHQSVFQWQLRP